ncbi:MAG TPA: glycosyltransferase family 4 protein [Chloroflexia bacterium]|nr:glycosyltransferase family 4 protein [Chloroflexia bacterium]
MQIAVCTAQVPFVQGGNEVLVAGLVAALRARGHQVAEIALPFKWYPRESLVGSVLAWRLVDIAAANGVPIDLAICTKFPSYVVQHPRKIVWLVHQYRQAYDWFGTPWSDLTATPEDTRFRRWLAALDRRTIGEARAVYAISRNVAARLQKFNGLAATPLYPPLRPGFHPGPAGDYVLHLNRLDAAKRVDLLLRAAALVPPDAAAGLRYLIAGDGPDRAALERLAATLGLGDRVRFLGRVPDAEAAELYAGARAVYYAPVDEDYGFATVEAFQSGKPVITTQDAGGVLEFVEDGVTGLVTAPEPARVAESLARVAADRALCLRLGTAGQARVAGITWDHVVDTLLAGAR